MSDDGKKTPRPGCTRNRRPHKQPEVIDSGREIRQTSYSGAMLGLAVGDALGTTLEFAAPGSFEPLTDMVGGGPFDLPAGAWTDDTSMALCLADSLLERRAFDPIDQLERYVRWWREGHNSSIGRCFDIGGSTFRALNRFEETGEPFPGDADPNGAGNAPLMRLAPIPLLWAFWPHRASQNAVFSARTTHGDPRAADAARLLCLMMITALFSRDKDEVFMIAEALSGRDGDGALHPEVAAVAAGSFREKEPPEIVGSGFIVESLEAALWALDRTSTWEEGALAAVNLGNDADTTGAIYGQLAGAIYGVDAIPTRWLDRLVMRDEIEARAAGLFFLSREMMEEMIAE